MLTLADVIIISAFRKEFLLQAAKGLEVQDGEICYPLAHR